MNTRYPKILARKLSERYVIIEAMTGSVKQLEMIVRTLQNDTILLQKTNKELIAITGEDKNLVRRRI